MTGSWTDSALIENVQTNTRIAWGIIALLFFVTAWSALGADSLQIVVILVGIGLMLLPAIAYHDMSVMPPWEVMLIVALTIVSYTLDLTSFASHISTYLIIIAFAALVIVELQLFSPVKMIPRFASGFVVLTSMAAADLWTMFRWLSNVYLETTYFNGVPSVIQEFTIVSVISLIGVPVYISYFNWQAEHDSRDFAQRRGKNDN
jgi:hypothetical protein